VKRPLHSGAVQWRFGKPILVMWAKSLLLSAIVALGAGTAPVSAQPRAPMVQPNWVMPVQQQERDVRPLREVVEILRSRYGGELISARLEDGARPVYVLRWRMPDGEVRDLRVDALR
jgi:hypothetical protein